MTGSVAAPGARPTGQSHTGGVRKTDQGMDGGVSPGNIQTNKPIKRGLTVISLLELHVKTSFGLKIYSILSITQITIASA